MRFEATIEIETPGDESITGVWEAVEGALEDGGLGADWIRNHGLVDAKLAGAKVEVTEVTDLDDDWPSNLFVTTLLVLFVVALLLVGAGISNLLEGVLP